MTPLITHQPREYLLRHQAEELTLTQAITLVLGTGNRYQPLPMLARQVALMYSQGPVGISELLQIPGLGLAKATALLAAFEFRRLASQPPEPLLLTSAEAVYTACADLLSESREHLVVFFLNIRQQVIRRELVAIGTATASLIHPREVFRPAVVANAQSLILAHNHPSGSPLPSSADLTVTKELARAGHQLGIQLADHVICAAKGFCSLRELHAHLFS